MTSDTSSQPTDALAMYREVAAELTAPGAQFEISQPGIAATRRMAGTKDSLFNVLAETWQKHSDRPLFDFDGETASYNQVAEDAARLCAALRDEYGIARGDVVGLVMRNCPAWFTTFFALTRMGAVAALLNSRSKGPDIAASAADVGARLIVADERCTERLSGETDIPVIDPARLAELIATGGDDDKPSSGSGEDPAMILFTSGTTGRPKGATIAHRNICTAARQLQYMGLLGMTIAAHRRGIPVEVIEQHARPTSPLLIVPMFHISGITQMMTTMLGGGTIGGMMRWDPAKAMDLIERAQLTQVSGPSLVMADLLDQPNAAERMKSVTSMVVAGQASPIALTARMKREFPQASQAAGWGMTELTGTVCSCSGPVFDQHPGKVGVPLPLVDIKLVDDQRNEVAQGEVGEIAVRGPTVTTGYWGLPDATAEAFDGEWLLTGDLGMIDEDGLLAIVDRAKDMVISAGENIYCAEVERVLAMVEHHHEVALFGVPDERLGERAIAAVVLAEGAPDSHDAEAVRSHAKAHLADYKVPTEVVFDLGPLPRNVTGKVDKPALKRLYEERQANAEA